MALNWNSIGSTFSGLSSALSAAGVSATSLPSIMGAIFMSTNPNKSEELALCSQMLSALGNPILEQALVMKLVTEQGMPASAATLAMTLLQPGVNIPETIMNIETLIKQGG